MHNVRTRWVVAVLGVLWFALALPRQAAAAATAAPSTTVREIVVRSEGAGPLLESFVKNHLATKVGEPLRGVTVSRDIRTLLDTGRFSAVRVEYEEVENGMLVIFVVANKLRLNSPIKVVGAKKFSERKIRKLIDLPLDAYVDEQTLATHCQAVRDAYAKKFYPLATITPEIHVVDELNGRADVTVTVNEGDTAKVSRYEFTGNTAISSGELRGVVKRFAWYNPFSWRRKLRADSMEMNEARLKIRDLYLEKGHLNVAVGEPEITRDADGHDVMTLHIEEGVAFSVGDIRLDGVTLFPEKEVRAALPLRGGQLASKSGIRAASQSLRDFYGTRGYLNAQAVPILEADDPTGLVGIVFQIQEGQLTNIRNIFMRGNSRTRDKVLRREILIFPGEKYDSVKVDRSERRLQNLGYFSTVDTVTEPVLGSNLDRDLVFDVEEQRTGNMIFGAGFSSIDKVIGFVEVSQGNFDIGGWPFTGAGQKLNARAQFGSKRRDYTLSFTEPWFLDRKLSFGVDLFDRSRELEGYSVDRRGVALRLGKPIAGRLRLDLQYKIEDERIKDSSNTNAWYTETGEEFYFPEEQKAVQSSLESRLTYDSRDQVFKPTRGNRATSAAQVSGGPLGFDTDLYKLSYESDHYFPLWKGHVLSVSFQAETMDAYGDTEELYLFDKLFIGGGRTIRGYDYRDVGPKVVQYDGAGNLIDHRPIGGRSLGLISAEYTIPLTSGVRLAGFYDMGNVWEETYTWDFDTYASSYGLELRLDIPQFPIRFYYAWSLEKDSELTSTDPFGFWIGF